MLRYGARSYRRVESSPWSDDVGASVAPPLEPPDWAELEPPPADGRDGGLGSGPELGAG